MLTKIEINSMRRSGSIKAMHVEIIETACAQLGLSLERGIRKDTDWDRITAYIVSHYSQEYFPEKIKLALDAKRREIFIIENSQNAHWSNNCGRTAVMTLDAVTEKIKSSNTASITWERDIGVSDFLQSITLPSDIHAIWDVSLINHTFLLERCPHAHRNAIVQSYQGAYNLQFWLNIALSRCTKPNDQTLLQDLRDNWQCPSDNQLDGLSQKMKNFFEASTLPDRKLYWKTLPFDPTDQNLNLKDNVTINRIIISPPFYNPIAADSLKDYMGVS